MVELDERADVKKKKKLKKKLKKSKEVIPGSIVKKKDKTKKKAVKFDTILSDAISELRRAAEETKTDELLDENEENDMMGSEDEEIINEKVHADLLKNFGVEEKKKRLKERVLPVEPKEYALQGKVAVSDLLASLNKQDGLKSVEHLAEIAKEKVKTLDEPLPRFQREQVDRVINYDKTKAEVSKWLPIVKRNRESEQMTFPLYHTRETKIKEDVSSFVNKKPTLPTSKLEEEIYEVLATNMPERPEHILTEEEERMLEELSVEEAGIRREELCKMRALLSYQEEKFRRKNKIKSKKYHKILKKERQKKEDKILSDAVKENPGAARSECEKADYLRALERISQKHKGGGKWNKNILHKNIKNPELKKALTEQRNLTKQLMERGEEEEKEEEEANVVEKDKHVFEVDPSNPWLIVGSALSNLSTFPAEVHSGSPTQTESAQVQCSTTESISKSTSESTSEPVKAIDGKRTEPETVKIPTVDQDALVEMAFANDDVVAQFVEEKEKIVDEQTEKDIDLTLPGWGSWAGSGTNDRPKKRIILKAKVQAPRKDAGLSHVIINTKKNRKLGQHQVSRLPHPYKSRAVFEREMRQPIGAQWNSVKSFKNMIKPLITVLDGHVIDPMTAPEGFDNVRIKGKKRTR